MPLGCPRRLFGIDLSMGALSAVLLSSWGLMAQAPKPHVTRLPVAKKAVSTKPQAEAILHEVRMQNLRLENVSLWPRSGCGGEWRAKIFNFNDVAVKGQLVPFQHRRDTGAWIAGPPVEVALEKNQQMTVVGEWKKQHATDQFKVAFRPDAESRTYREVILDFPEDGVDVQLSVQGLEMKENRLYFALRNDGSKAICQMTVKLERATASAPTTWVNAGERTSALAARSSDEEVYAFDSLAEWKAGWSFVRIQLKRSKPSGVAEVLAERVFPLQ